MPLKQANASPLNRKLTFSRPAIGRVLTSTAVVSTFRIAIDGRQSSEVLESELKIACVLVMTIRLS